MSTSKSLDPNLTASGACRWCGAYGGSQHASTCNPQRKFPLPLESHPRALRDAHLSAVVRAYYRVQEELIRGL
jgi:hypothetical protein